MKRVIFAALAAACVFAIGVPPQASASSMTPLGSYSGQTVAIAPDIGIMTPDIGNNTVMTDLALIDQGIASGPPEVGAPAIASAFPAPLKHYYIQDATIADLACPLPSLTIAMSSAPIDTTVAVGANYPVGWSFPTFPT